MENIMKRVFEVTGCHTQLELVGFLGVRQSQISDAKKRGIIPKDWLDFLQRTKGIRPEWILSGTLPKYESAEQ